MPSRHGLSKSDRWRNSRAMQGVQWLEAEELEAHEQRAVPFSATHLHLHPLVQRVLLEQQGTRKLAVQPQKRCIASIQSDGMPLCLSSVCCAASVTMLRLSKCTRATWLVFKRATKCMRHAGDAAEKAARKRHSKKPGPNNRRGWLDEKVPHFQLREGNSGEPGGMQQLTSMFGGALPHAVIADVYEASQHDVQRSVEALLLISEGAGRAAQPADVQSAEDPGAPSTLEHSQRRHAVSKPRIEQCAGNVHALSSDTLHWHGLPEDCKLLIVSLLDSSAMAATAAADRACAQLVAARRARVSVVTARTSVLGLPNCMRCHPNASAVRVSNCASGTAASLLCGATGVLPSSVPLYPCAPVLQCMTLLYVAKTAVHCH